MQKKEKILVNTATYPSRKAFYIYNIPSPFNDRKSCTMRVLLGRLRGHREARQVGPGLHGAYGGLLPQR